MLKELIRYTEVADSIFISTFSGIQKNLPEAEALFSHILNAQHIWISRIKHIDSLYDRLEIHPKENFGKVHAENITNMYELANSDLDFTVAYSNSAGEIFENNALDILYHMINHSTYHRAQIATQFRLNNIQPPVTDFIFLKRQNLL